MGETPINCAVQKCRDCGREYSGSTCKPCPYCENKPKAEELKACPSCEAEKIPLCADICLPCGEAGYTSKKLKIDKDEGESKDLPDAIPSTWLDPLLTGPDSIGPPPYNCKDIERLLNGLRERLKAKLSKPTAPADEEDKGRSCHSVEEHDARAIEELNTDVATLQAALAKKEKEIEELKIEIKEQVAFKMGRHREALKYSGQLHNTKVTMGDKIFQLNRQVENQKAKLKSVKAVVEAANQLDISPCPEGCGIIQYEDDGSLKAALSEHDKETT